MEPDAKLIRALKTFVAVGAVVLVVGTAALAWLLVNRPPPADTPVADGPRGLPVPAEFRAASASFQDGRVLVLGATTDGRQMIVIADPRKPDLATVLVLEPR